GSLALAPAAFANYDTNNKHLKLGATGNHRVAAMLINFDDDPLQPFSAEETNGALFNGDDSVADYFSSVSTGKLHMTGDVFNWVTVPNFLKKTQCSDEALLKLGSTAYKAVEKTNAVDLSGYDNYMFIMPRQNVCINDNN